MGTDCVDVVGTVAPVPFWLLPHTSVLSSNILCVCDNNYTVLMSCHVFYDFLHIIYLQVTIHQLKVSLKMLVAGTAKCYG
jgi:hypothetical protein